MLHIRIGKLSKTTYSAPTSVIIYGQWVSNYNYGQLAWPLLCKILRVKLIYSYLTLFKPGHFDDRDSRGGGKVCPPYLSPKLLGIFRFSQRVLKADAILHRNGALIFHLTTRKRGLKRDSSKNLMRARNGL